MENLRKGRKDRKDKEVNCLKEVDSAAMEIIHQRLDWQVTKIKIERFKRTKAKYQGY